MECEMESRLTSFNSSPGDTMNTKRKLDNFPVTPRVALQTDSTIKIQKREIPLRRSFSDAKISQTFAVPAVAPFHSVGKKSVFSPVTELVAAQRSQQAEMRKNSTQYTEENRKDDLMHTSECSPAQPNLFGHTLSQEKLQHQSQMDQSQNSNIFITNTSNCFHSTATSSKKRLSIDLKLRSSRMPEGSQSRIAIHRRSLQPIRRMRNPGKLSLNLSQVDKAVIFDENEAALRRQDHAGICSRITEFLYIGGSTAAKDFDSLSTLGITHVINCAACVVPAYFTDDFIYYNLRLRDHSSQEIGRHFYSIFNFIESARASGGKIFVHCVKGISRSPTLAIAYIMWSKRMGVYQALEFVRHARPVVDPNAGFIFQLTEWEQLHLQGTIQFTAQPLVFRIDVYIEDTILDNFGQHHGSGENGLDILNEVHTSSYNQKEEPVTNRKSMRKYPMIVGPLNFMTQKHFFSPTKQNMLSSFVISSADYMCLWCGSGVSSEQIQAVEEAKLLLQRFESFPHRCDYVFHGQEHDAFWRLVSDLPIG